MRLMKLSTRRFALDLPELGLDVSTAWMGETEQFRSSVELLKLVERSFYWADPRYCLEPVVHQQG